MRRTFRLGVLLGLFAVAGLAFPSTADAQRGGRGGGGGARGGGGAPSGGGVRTGGQGGHGGAVYRGSQVAVPRTYPPYSSPYYRSYYSHPYYYRPYYYRPYYSGYYPYYYSPWSFSLSFGGWYGGYYAPYYAYPYYAAPYVAAPPAYSSPSAYPDNEYRNSLSTPSRVDDRGSFGTLSIRVMPADATILIDQQAWDRPRGDERFSIELVEGPHQVEIRKAGYATYVRTIDVVRGQSVVVNVALTTGGTGTIQVARTVPLRH